MKTDKRFITVYDAIFSYIFKTQKLDGLIKFWKVLAPTILLDLKEIAAKEGVKGCKKYWDKVLTEEGAKFRTKLSKDGKTLDLEITECPSIKHLNMPSCSEYCRHCPVMFEEVLKPVGILVVFKRKGNGQCGWKLNTEETDR